MIDWARLAEPQQDQYDTEVILQLAPRARKSRPNAPAIFDGNVAVRYACRELPEFHSLRARYPDGPPDHPNIAAADRYIRAWPAAFAQCARLLDVLHPAIDPRTPLESSDVYRGSVCHSAGWGTVWATIFCPLGLAEALVRELANQKLRVLGPAFDSLRDLYADLHVVTLDIRILQAETDAARREPLREVLAKNLARISRAVQSDTQANDFTSALFRWLHRTIAEAHALLRTSSPSDLLAARHPVVFAYNGGIGDKLCNLPALRALAHLFEGRLALVCRTGDRDLYYSDLNLRAVHEIEFTQASTGWLFDADSLARRIGECDLLLSINPWHTSSVSALLAKFPGIPSVGFFAEFSHPLNCDFVGHAIDMAFAVPAWLSPALNLSDYRHPPTLSPAATATARAFRRNLGGRPTIFVHTDSKPEKTWPRERFTQALDHFLHEFPEFIALVVDVRGERIGVGRYPERVVPLKAPLDICFAILRDADHFIGIDSCHLHAADLFGVPGIGLFGPTTSRRWGYRFTKFRAVEGRGSMDAITVEEVCHALRALRQECGQRESRPSVTAISVPA